MASDPDTVLLATASSQIEANIWRDALEQEGIRPYIRNSNTLAYLGGSNMFGRFDVFVLARDLKRARWIIGESAAPYGEVIGEGMEEQETAPAD